MRIQFLAQAAFSAAIDKALEATKSYALGQLVARTPKRSGRLAGAWVGLKTNRALLLKNDTPYAPYVEEGTVHMRGYMMRRSIPEIRRKLADELLNAYTRLN